MDYYFLLGFYHRHKGNKSKALEYYYKVLDIHPDHSRTKREIVNILLSQEKYADALELARSNYEKRKTNIYHIHSYFVCLIRKKGKISERDLVILNSLMSAVKNSSDIKAEDIYRCMEGEYAFY
ncbi:tetratricopeptide repeat protein, partial [Bacteroides fragilis]|uniref:tetratricopeptide repeat protein n=1 Tax=Bacteroides fragilis TaxID=817 RepID=UPI00374F5BBF